MKPTVGPEGEKRAAAPTLEDVARRAGVSTATVSRCLNATATVSEATRKSVMKAVEALGYTPNFAARAMAARRTHTIGAIIPTMENAIFARGLQAFQEELNGLGYTLLVSSSGYRPDAEAEQIRTLVARGADGLLLIGFERDDEIRADLERRGIPVLVAWAWRNGQASVGFDNRAAMRTLCGRVTGLGHRKIGFVSGIVQGNDRASARLAGFRDGLVDAGLDPDMAPVTEAAYDTESGGRALETLLAQHPDLSVVMCANDVLAVGAIAWARKAGLNVPRDISITGFDDIELARIVSPGLTTVHVPHAQMGRLAAAELVRMVEKQSPGTSRKLEVTFEMRESLCSLV